MKRVVRIETKKEGQPRVPQRVRGVRSRTRRTPLDRNPCHSVDFSVAAHRALFEGQSDWHESR